MDTEDAVRKKKCWKNKESIVEPENECRKRVPGSGQRAAGTLSFIQMPTVKPNDVCSSNGDHLLDGTAPVTLCRYLFYGARDGYLFEARRVARSPTHSLSRLLAEGGVRSFAATAMQLAHYHVSLHRFFAIIVTTTSGSRCTRVRSHSTTTSGEFVSCRQRCSKLQ